MASGVLVVLLGEGTKLAPFLSAQDKSYEARIVLGRATTTWDAEGETTGEQPIPEWLAAEVDRLCRLDAVSPEVLRQLAPRMSAALALEASRTQQQPPAYSAIKVSGRRSYDRARAGEQVVLGERQVGVAEIELLRATAPAQCLPHVALLELRLRASKGYYVRSLARDIGAHLGVPAHLGALRRTASGPFPIATAVALAAGRAALQAAIQPVAAAAATSLPVARLSPSGVAGARQGKRLCEADFQGLPPPLEGPSAWLDPDGRLVAVGSWHHVPGQSTAPGDTVTHGFAVVRGFSDEPADRGEGDEGVE
jgi:tRNA pseudouridine55 synthase